MKRHRKAEVRRETRETSVVLKLNLDGSGKHSIATGVPFFDHMLSLLAYHSSMDVFLKAKGDIGGLAAHRAFGRRECLGRADGHRARL